MRWAILITLLCGWASQGCARRSSERLVDGKPAADGQRVLAQPVPAAATELGQVTLDQRQARLSKAVERGVAFLVGSQTSRGAWGTGTETRGLELFSMVPGSHDAYRVATTALCVMALRQAGEKVAHDRGVEYLVTFGEARRDDGALMYNTWAHIYALQALAMEMRQNNDPRLRTRAMWHLDRLARYETFEGGWAYYDFEAHTQISSMGPTSFGTAAGLVALWEARKSGLEVPQRMIDRALSRLVEMRLPNGAYLYGTEYKYIPLLPANRVRGSIGRTQVCNHALWLWQSGKIGPAQVLAGLQVFEKEHVYIEMGRKRPLPHDSWYQTAPYYFYFDHYYASKLLERLKPDDRRHYAGFLSDVVLGLQEADGSWWDYAMWDYHKPYGTAFALMTLLQCR